MQESQREKEKEEEEKQAGISDSYYSYQEIKYNPAVLGIINSNN